MKQAEREIRDRSSAECSKTIKAALPVIERGYMKQVNAFLKDPNGIHHASAAVVRYELHLAGYKDREIPSLIWSWESLELIKKILKKHGLAVNKMNVICKQEPKK